MWATISCLRIPKGYHRWWLTAGLASIVLSLPHRGRLSLLCDPDLLVYSPTALFAKIKGQPEFDPSTAPGATGDVISHLAAIKKIEYEKGEIKVEVLQNPSHLEVSSSCVTMYHWSLNHSPGRQSRCSRSNSSQTNVAPQIINCRMSTWWSSPLRSTPRRRSILRSRCRGWIPRIVRSPTLRIRGYYPHYCQ